MRFSTFSAGFLDKSLKNTGILAFALTFFCRFSADIYGVYMDPIWRCLRIYDSVCYICSPYITHIRSFSSCYPHIYDSIQSIYGIYMDPPSLHFYIYDSVQSIFNLYTILYSIYMTHIWSSPRRHLHICDSIQYIFSTYMAHIRASPRHCSCIYDSVQSIFNPYLIYI